MKFFSHLIHLKHIRDFALIIVGVLSASLGLNGFVLPNNFTDGGITGISILVSKASGIPIYIWIAVLNIPFIILGYRQISKLFALKTLFGIIALSVTLWLIRFPEISNDKLLVAVFGGFFLGSGIGLCIRGGGVVDGTEVLALTISKRTILSIGDVILIINIFIFSAAAFTLGFEAALYSVLTYLAASKTVDFIVQGIEEYTSVTIVSSRNDEIRRAIIEIMGRGVTILKGEGGYGKTGTPGEDINVLYCVVTRLEIPKLRTIIDKLDPNAFFVIQSVNEIRGGTVKKRPLY